MKNSRSVLCFSITLLISGLVFAAAAKTGKVTYAKGDVRGHLRQLGTALMMYAVDYDEVLPSMNDAKKLSRFDSAIFKGQEIFNRPAHQQTFRAKCPFVGTRIK